MRIEWVATIFMISGSVPFYLYIKSVRADRAALLKDQQVRGLLMDQTVLIGSVRMSGAPLVPAIMNTGVPASSASTTVVG